MDDASAGADFLDVSGPLAGGSGGARASRRRRLRSRFGLPLHQLRRALAEPRRLRRLHPAIVRASLRSVVEPSERRFVCDAFGIDDAGFRRLEADLLGDRAFIDALESRHRAVRGVSIQLLGEAYAEDHDRSHRLLYYAARLVCPEVAVETGVFDGFSSAFLLKALDDNGRGRLYSVDLPARIPLPASTDRMAFDTLPAGAEPGWIVPEDLRARWTIRLGESRRVLEPWLRELAPIGLFFHDSLHTRDNMEWEFGVAWQALGAGGLLMSDDVYWSSAFRDFGRAIGARGRILRGVGFQWKPGVAA
jgi:hypothetical protein